MSTVIQRQLAELKRRVAELESQLAATKATDEERFDEVDATKLQKAELLFDSLVAARPVNLVTYSRAYREVVGSYSDWRNAVHAPEIIRIARLTRPRTVQGVEIRLDALIVSRTNQVPAPGHFRTARYPLEIWMQKFGGHPVLA